MKLKGKLIMSAAALAACAATLTSTTYAWYTSNTEVKATGVTGTTAASGSELLLISDTGADGSWSNAITLSKEDVAGNKNIDGDQLMPVAHAAEGEYKGWDGSAVSDTAASNTDYLQFDLFFKATKELPVYVNGFTITNTTKALPFKDILANAGGLTASNTNKTYTVDVRRALKVETKTEVVTKGTADTPSYGQYNLSKLDTYEDSLKSLSSYNAHTYFNTVTGNHIETEVTTAQSVASTEIKKNTGTTKWTLGKTPVATEAGDATYLKVTFIVYLDGWDLACFDACQGQSISIALNFTCEADASGMLYTA